MSILEVENLTTRFRTPEGTVTAVDDVSFSIDRNERAALVGESGAGKSVTGKSVLRLIEHPGEVKEESRVQWKGTDLLAKSDAEMDAIRGAEIAWIPQDPLSSLNPTRTIGLQIIETMRAHDYLDTDAERREQAIDLLEQVGIPDPSTRLSDYPHEYSGGMRQRVLIAIAISCEPDLIIADEPTTALDVYTQAQIIDRLEQLTEDEMSLLLISHGFGLIAELCETVMVMYAGEIVEKSDVRPLFDEPLHPYTQELLKCSPHLMARENLNTIPGSMPVGVERPSGCQFHPRCPKAFEDCPEVEPDLRAQDGRDVSCLLYEEGDYT